MEIAMIELSNDATPLYQKVKEYILRNIGDGSWAQNHRLPSEHDLVATMGVSRMTVHRALRELTAAGFLKRVQGVGTFVRIPEPRSELLEINNIATEIETRGNRHTSKVLVLEKSMASEDLASRFEFERRRRVYHSVVVHFENDIPVQLEERFVNPDLVPGYDEQDFTKSTTYDYLMKATPLTELEHLIYAVAADRDTARILRVPVGAPCLLLRRRTWSGARVATVNNLSYAGDRYSLGTVHRQRR